MQEVDFSRTAIVCGATGLVGSSIAKSLAAIRIKTIIQYHSSCESANRLVAEINEAGGCAAALHLEASDQKSVREFVHSAQQLFGSIHVLVNAIHGPWIPKYITDMEWEDWSIHLDALKAHFLLCKEVVPVMRAQHYGRIVFVSGGLSKRYFPGCSAYTTIKSGLNGFCKTLALEEGRNGITVNIVAPGRVEPSDDRESKNETEGLEKLNQQSISNIPLGQYASTRDVSTAVLYFVSNEAAGITGQTLFVAGGEIIP